MVLPAERRRHAARSIAARHPARNRWQRGCRRGEPRGAGVLVVRPSRRGPPPPGRASSEGVVGVASVRRIGSPRKQQAARQASRPALRRAHVPPRTCAARKMRALRRDCARGGAGLAVFLEVKRSRAGDLELSHPARPPEASRRSAERRKPPPPATWRAAPSTRGGLDGGESRRTRPSPAEISCGLAARASMHVRAPRAARRRCAREVIVPPRTASIARLFPFIGIRRCCAAARASSAPYSSSDSRRR